MSDPGARTVPPAGHTTKEASANSILPAFRGGGHHDPGWGRWSPLARDVPHLGSGWQHVSAAEQEESRPCNRVPELSLVLDVLATCPGTVLDLACGTGRVALALAEAGHRVVGVDHNAGFIRAARARAAGLPPHSPAPRFLIGDARRLQLRRRFSLVLMLDQSFKYLLTHQDQLACLRGIRRHLHPHGRFLVEHRCLLRLPWLEEGEPYAYSRRGETWVGHDVYDPVEQVGLHSCRPLADPAGPAYLEPCRDFTCRELSLLHHVTGFALERVWHDLDTRPPTAAYFDATMLLRPVRRGERRR